VLGPGFLRKENGDVRAAKTGLLEDVHGVLHASVVRVDS
jgi:hypothetical protein